jgi:hypothetical protein
MAFTVAKGITMTVEGDTNDYTGKGLSGGKIAAYPKADIIAAGFAAEDHVAVGKVCFTERRLERPSSLVKLESASAFVILAPSPSLRALVTMVAST